MDENNNKILMFIKKNIILVIILAILLVVALFFILKPKEEIKFELYGSSNVNVYVGNKYYEYGYYLNSKEYNVEVISNVDTNKIGKYMIRYRLLTKNGKFKLEKVRMVNVIEDTLKNVTLTLKGDNPSYILVNNPYKEDGATALYNGVDISSSIITSGRVDVNKVGNYEVKYTIEMDNRDKTISRFVSVFDMNFKSEVDYTNKIIKAQVESYDFDYVLLPNLEKTTETEFEFKYSKTGSNIFTIYTKSGYSKKYEVRVLDKDKPTGSCVAKINGNTTNVTITASDDGGISKYVYGSQTFKTNEFTINQKLDTFMVRVFDSSDNYVDVECKTRRLFDNNMNDIKLSSTLTPCHNDWSSYNRELANLVLEYGPKTRDAVAASDEYLAKFPFMIAYSWGGKSKAPGINSEWGCSKGTSLHDGKLVCTKVTGDSTCIYGMDCTGYTAWAYINAGFDPSIIRTSEQSEGRWGNFIARQHRYTFRGNPDKVAQIKPGDIVHKPGHVGIVIGTDETRIKVANMVGGIIITYLNKSNGASLNHQQSFEDFVLMDEFFEMYGNKY